MSWRWKLKYAAHVLSKSLSLFNYQLNMHYTLTANEDRINALIQSLSTVIYFLHFLLNSCIGYMLQNSETLKSKRDSICFAS